MIKISDCFHYIIIFVMLCNEVGWHDLQLDRFLENLQIVQCNLETGWPIYQLADWQMGRNIYYTVVSENEMDLE